MSLKRFLAAALVCAVATSTAHAQTSTVTIEGLPSVRFEQAPLITPADALTYYNARPGALTSPALSTEPRDPRIQRLADSLDNDAWRIYEYVANSIETTPQFGLEKGAFGAILDGYGNPFDQANLMVELLREAGTVANYQYGEVEFTGADIADFTDWMGPATARGACELLSGGGIPAIINGSTQNDCASFAHTAGSLTSVRMAHIWVIANLGNGLRAYDPSFKRHVRTGRSAIFDTLPAASAYRGATGGALGTYSGIPAITGLNATSVTNLDNALTGATTSLLAQLQQPANMNQSLVEIAGGTRIEIANLYHKDLDTATASHPYQAATTAQWTGDIPTALRATLTIDVQLNIGGTLQMATRDIAELAGRRLTLIPFSIGNNASATIWLDEELLLQAQYSGGCATCQMTGFGTMVGLSIDHAYATNSGWYMDEVWRQPVSDVSTSVLLTSWGDRGPGAEARNVRAFAADGQVHRQPYTAGSSPECYAAETQAIANSSAADTPHSIAYIHVEKTEYTDGRVEITKTLRTRLDVSAGSGGGVVVGNCMPTLEEQASLAFFSAQSRTKMQVSESWPARAEELLRALDGVSANRHLNHHMIGVVTSRADIGNDNSIREDQLLLSVTSRLSTAPLGPNSSNKAALVQAASSGLSALESATTREASGAPEANSTASMFQWYLTSPNVPAQGLGSGGSRIFLLADATNFTSVAQQIFEYAGPATTYAEAFAHADFNLILPLSGRLGPSVDAIRFPGESVGGADYWRRLGSAYMAYSDTPGLFHSVAHMTAPACGTERYQLRQSMSCLRLPLKGSGAATFATELNGPTAEREFLDEQYDAWASSFSVDVSTGSMTFTPPADIETGAGGYPYSLAFQRSYNSGSQSSGPLGTGWSHNLEARLEVGSDIRAATSGTAQQAAATLVAADAILSLFEGGGDQVDMVRALLIQNWWAESLVNNSVSIQRGSGSEQFYRMADGSFISSPGARTTLTQQGSITIDTETGDYSEHDGTTWLSVANIEFRAFDYSALSFSYDTQDGLTEQFVYGADTTHSTGILPMADNNQNQTIGSHRTFLRTISTHETGPSDVILTYSYANGALSRVENNLGRQLNFSYLHTDPLNPPVEQIAGSAPLGPAYILTAVTDENGRTVSFGVDDSALLFNRRRLDTVTDPQGHQSSYTYATQRAWSIGGLGGTPAMPLDELVLLTEIRLPHAPTTAYLSFGYDEVGRLLTVTDADGDTTTYGVGEGARGMVRDPAGVEAWSFFDQDGRQTGSSNRRSPVTVSTFDGIGRLTSQHFRGVNHPDTYFWTGSETVYDQYNNVVEARVLARPGWPDIPSSQPSLITFTQYDHPGQPTWPTRIIDPRGNTASVTCYSSATNEAECSGLGLDGNTRGGLPQAVIGAEGETTIIVYGANGLPIETRTKVTATEWRTSQIVYGANGLPSLSRLVNNSTTFGGADLETQFFWTSAGDLQRVVDPTGADVTALYDNNRRIISMSALPGNADLSQYSEFTYNNSGWLTSTGTSITGAAGGQMLTTSVTYTASGQAETILDPDDGIAPGEVGQSFVYNSRGWLESLTDGAGRQTRHNYYSTGEPFCSRAGYGTADQRTTRNIYLYAWGSIGSFYQSNADRDSDCTVTDAGEDPYTTWRTSIIVDAYMRGYNTVYPNGHWDHRDMDTNDNVTLRRRFTPDSATGAATERWRHTSTFDQSNRVTSLVTPEGTTNTTHNFAGEVTRIELVGGDWLEYEYDFAGNQTLERRHNAINTAYEYDMAGRRTAIRWHDNFVARYVYNIAGQLVRVEEDANGDGTSERTLSEYVYDRIGRLSERHIGGFDQYGDQTAPGTKANSGIEYTYEADGELVQMRHVFDGTAVTFAYDYDGSGRLIAEYASAPGWLWSAAGRTQSWAFASDDAVRPGEPTNVQNQYGRYVHLDGPASNTHTLSYDYSDNLIGDGTRFFNHDTRNRLTGVVEAGQTTGYYYDVIGRRQWKALDNGASWTGYVHAGGMEIGEINGAGQYLVRYIPGPGIDQREAMIITNPATGAAISRHYYHANRLGSVIALADQAGVLTDQYQYTPYGVENLLDTSGNPFRYTGRRYDPESGLYYYRARYYWPEIGRFLETDPIGYADQMNLYAYVGSDPLNATDPTGEQRVNRMTLDEHGCGASSCYAEAAIYDEFVIGRSATETFMDTNPAMTLTGLGDAFFAGRGVRAGDYGFAASRLGSSLLKASVFASPLRFSRAGGTGLAGSSSLTEVRALLQSAANDSVRAVGPGSGAVYGTKIHTEFAARIRAMNQRGVASEASFLGGAEVRYGTAGSVRPDVTVTLRGETHLFDLKTGTARISEGWTQRAAANVPDVCSIKCIRPN